MRGVEDVGVLTRKLPGSGLEISAAFSHWMLTERPKIR